MTVAEFIAKWSASGAAERANKVRETLQASKRSLSAPEAAKLFKGAKLTEVEAVLESLSSLGLVLSFEASGIRRWRAGAR
jgi:hypothetical protein